MWHFKNLAFFIPAVNNNAAYISTYIPVKKQAKTSFTAFSKEGSKKGGVRVVQICWAIQDSLPYTPYPKALSTIVIYISDSVENCIDLFIPSVPHNKTVSECRGEVSNESFSVQNHLGHDYTLERQCCFLQSVSCIALHPKPAPSTSKPSTT